MMCFSLSACGEKNTNSNSSSPKVTTSASTSTAYTTTVTTEITTEKITDRDDDTGIMDPDSGNVSENGVMPDVTSPLEEIPDIIETAVSGAEDIVSDVIDDLT